MMPKSRRTILDIFYMPDTDDLRPNCELPPEGVLLCRNCHHDAWIHMREDRIPGRSGCGNCETCPAFRWPGITPKILKKLLII